jgi:RNA polymerase sigma-70 factor (ECF subfamily)
VTAWAAGDARAGDLFLRRYFPLLWRFFRNKTEHDVADLVQRTMLSAVRNRGKLAAADHVRAYLLATARHELYATLRRSRGAGFDPLRSSLVGESTSPSRAAERSMRRTQLREQLLQLPVPLAEAIELHYFEGLSGPELAEALGIPEATVRGRLHRAKRRLAQQLGTHCDELLDG